MLDKLSENGEIILLEGIGSAWQAGAELEPMFCLGMNFLPWQLMLPDGSNGSWDQHFYSALPGSGLVHIDHVHDFKFEEL